MDSRRVVAELRSMSNPTNVAGMKRFGISGKDMLGISVTDLRKMAKKLGKSHDLAASLWKTGIHEARILASMVDEPGRVTAKQMDSWASEFDSWDICDGCCGNLFDRAPFAHSKAMEWSRAEKEFVKRAGFSLMAGLAVHDKSATDADFRKFFPAIKRGSTDERNFVRKSVNWALRQIGKRNRRLNRSAMMLAAEISRLDSRSARWVAADALRELRSPQVASKLRKAA